MRFTPRWVLYAIFLLAFTGTASAAQVDAACFALVQQALSSFGDNCAEIPGQTICYGHSQVTLTATDATTSFEAVGDRADLKTLGTLQTSGADVTSGEWGLAAINLVDTGSGPAAMMLLLGDVRLENLSDADAILPDQFVFRNGLQDAGCSETPSVLAVQTGTDIVLNFTLNGAKLRASSLVTFQQQSENALVAHVYSGQLEISGGATVQAGQSITGITDNDGQILFWSAPRGGAKAELDTAAVARTALEQIGLQISAPVVPTAVPTAIPTLQPSPTAVPASGSCGNSTTHVVSAGENLFRIAMRYGTTIEAIASANGIADPSQIVVGQTLTIPCGTDRGGSSGAPASGGNDSAGEANPAEPTPAGETSSPTLDCNNLGAFPGSVPPEFAQLFQQFCSGG